MLVWQGRGILVPILFFAVIIASMMLFSDPNIPIFQSLAPLIALILTGVVCFYLGKKWNDEQGRIVIDKQTNQEIEIKRKDTFFWIDIYHWAFILGILAIIYAISLYF